MYVGMYVCTYARPWIGRQLFAFAAVSRTLRDGRSWKEGGLGGRIAALLDTHRQTLRELFFTETTSPVGERAPGNCRVCLENVPGNNLNTGNSRAGNWNWELPAG